ncbi:MAG: FmdE family protein [Pseudomonadota bacterium]
MTVSDIQSSADWKKVVEFHGHVCPGLAIGFKAAGAAMDRLKEHRSEDEELLAIVENNACGVDAVQVLTGCTFGKGNFIHHDHGKHVYSIVSRNSGRGVRIALKAGAFQPSERHMELIQKIRSDTATDQERAEFKTIHQAKSYELLEKPAVELFNIESVTLEVPPKARMEPSKVCERCGEPTMASKLRTEGDSVVCRSCSGTPS